jgi:hypothetical protein
VLVRALTYRRTSVSEAKKEEQEQQVVLSWPSSSATTTVVVANGDPPFRKVTGPALGPKLYATVVVPIDSLLKPRYQTLQA